MPATKRYFTLSEATRTLPLVRRIVADINETGAILYRLNQQGKMEGSEFRRAFDEMRGLLGELDQLGCYYKDWNFDVGLVDFPAIIEGEEVLLCWRSDEDSITHYHRYEEGYAGRREIPEEDPRLSHLHTPFQVHSGRLNPGEKVVD